MQLLWQGGKKVHSTKERSLTQRQTVSLDRFTQKLMTCEQSYELRVVPDISMLLVQLKLCVSDLRKEVNLVISHCWSAFKSENQAELFNSRILYKRTERRSTVVLPCLC